MISNRAPGDLPLLPSEPLGAHDVLLESIGLAAMTLDSHGRVTMANGAALSLVGYDRAQVIGRDATELVAAEHRERVLMLLDLVAAGTTWSGRLTAQRADGQARPVSIIVGPLRDADGAIVGVTGIGWDVSRELAAEARFRALFESTSIGVMIAGLDGMIVEWNPAMAVMLGHGDDALPLHFSEVTHPEDLPREQELVDALLAGSGRGYTIEKRYLRRDGSVVWGSLRATIVRDEQDRVICGLGIVEDISERKQMERALRESEQRYRALVELAPDGIVVERDSSILYANTAAARMVGVDDPSKLVQRPARMVRTSRPHLDVREAPIPLSGGDAQIVVLRDLSDRVRMEKELRELATRLASAREAEQARVARELHDDLGQRLTALKLDLAWVARKIADQTDEGSRPELAAIGERVHGMTELVDDTFRSMRGLLMDLRPMILDDLGLEAAIEWHVGRFAERTGLRCHLSVSLPPHERNTHRDSACFRIVQEALTNVARHARAQQVWVRLAREGDLSLEVRDDGVGISDAALSHPAMGIVGMRERAHALGGSVDVRRESPRGTSIHARLPW